MRKQITLFAICGFLAMAGVMAQKPALYIPKEYQKAYEAGTRSYTGAPAENYYQNTANYDIKANFDPESGILEGKETIKYFNNSPDTLKNLVIRVYMNFFQKGVQRDFHIGPTDLHDGVTIDDITVDGRKINTPGGPQLANDRGTNYEIKLLNPLTPDGETEIFLEWKVQLPVEVAIRMGRYGESDNWFVAFWYPKVAVYDDISGWDTHSFTGSAEFYHDFNNYEVELTLPGDYMVWATGILQEPGIHYEKDILERIEKAETTEDVIHIVTPEDIENNRVLKRRGEHTWHFTAEEVPDFAFAASKEYIWDGTSVEVDHQTGRRTFVSAVYDANTSHFHQVAGLGRKIIGLLSDEIMGVPFAYPKLTAFNGSGGMEFPMMINDGDVSHYEGTVHLTAHEIGHNYFPFLVMTNESYYAFMDEGLISFLPRIAEKQLLENYDPFVDLVRQYERNAGNMGEIPLMVKSYMISDYSAYRLHAYQRPATAFYLLRELVGKEAFHSALKTYIQRWAKKHPTPYDFFFTFDDVLNRDLSWFWEPWFFGFGYPDLAISNVEGKGNETLITIERKGDFPVPVHLEVRFVNGETKVYNESMAVWKDGRKKFVLTIREQQSIKSIHVGSERIPDINPENNNYIINN